MVDTVADRLAKGCGCDTWRTRSNVEDKALLNTMADTLTKTKAKALNDKPGDVEALTDYLSDAQAQVVAKTPGVEAEALINTGEGLDTWRHTGRCRGQRTAKRSN